MITFTIPSWSRQYQEACQGGAQRISNLDWELAPKGYQGYVRGKGPCCQQVRTLVRSACETNLAIPCFDHDFQKPHVEQGCRRARPSRTKPLLSLMQITGKVEKWKSGKVERWKGGKLKVLSGDLIILQQLSIRRCDLLCVENDV